MKLYPDTEKELTLENDYKPLPTLRGMSANDLRELKDNIENAIENAWSAGADLLRIALEMDLNKIDLYLHFAEKKEGKSNV